MPAVMGREDEEEIQKKTGYIVMQEDGTFDVDANTSIDQLSEELNVKIPEGHQYETVSGFICESFGYIPKEGAKMVVLLDKVNEEDNNEYTESDDKDEKEKHQTFELEIVEANERKVGKVRFKPINNGSPDLEAKGLNRVFSTKVVKGIESDSENTGAVADGLRKNSYLHQPPFQEERLDDTSYFATTKKVDDLDSISQQ